MNDMMVFEMAGGSLQHIPCDVRATSEMLRHIKDWGMEKEILRVTPYAMQQMPYEMLPADVQEAIVETLESNDICNIWYESGRWHSTSKHYTNAVGEDDYYWAGRFERTDTYDDPVNLFPIMFRGGRK